MDGLHGPAPEIIDEVKEGDDVKLDMITMDRQKARELFLDYRRSVRDRHDAEDEAIMRGYRELSRGRQIIRLSEAMIAGGARTRSAQVSEWDSKQRRNVRKTIERTLPRLGVVRADAEWVFTRGIAEDGSCRFTMDRETLSHATRRQIGMPAGTFGAPAHPALPWGGLRWRAMVPIVPPPLRPKAGLVNFHVLFEADWRLDAPPAPRDPALLRRLGGDLFVVLATWDLTEIERAVLAGRT